MAVLMDDYMDTLMTAIMDTVDSGIPGYGGCMFCSSNLVTLIYKNNLVTLF
jgi:hypothetical protein